MLFIFISACDSILNNEDDGSQNHNNDSEFIITPGDGEKDDWFLVKELQSEKMTGVPAVQCLEGNIYLPIHSHVPDFNNKVVKGVFIPDTVYYNELKDTIFMITAHLRDTTLGFYGE